MMRRLIILMCVVILVLDLAEDGRLGQSKVVDLRGLGQTSAPSYLHHADPQDIEAPSGENFAHHCGRGHLQLSLLPSLLLEIFQPSPSQPVTAGVQLSLKIIDCCNSGSSGGIPL
jgi:hypothetical protein